jgi:hypothetical protein
MKHCPKYPFPVHEVALRFVGLWIEPDLIGFQPVKLTANDKFFWPERYYPYG